MQRRVEQAYGHLVACHRPEYLFKVAPLHGREPPEVAPPLGVRRGHDHVLEQADAALFVEHALGPAQPDPARAVLARLPCGRRRVGVGAHAEPLGGARPPEYGPELGGNARLDRRQGPPVHRAVAAVDRDRLALPDGRAVRQRAPRCRVVYAHAGRAHNARLSHAARDDRRVRRLAAAARQYAGRRVECGHVLGLCLLAHQDHGPACLAEALGAPHVEHGRPGRRAGRCGDPADRRPGRLSRPFLQHWVQELV